ncbi:helix-turn-helix transcriptional regulator [Actinoplanes regularis]|uniref:Regulatory protein, luxR family n=1 Tax=Actinoplanes regularis TaxID=52697 RepID=A0A239BT05_9ACTN|nr:LuxR family transcriptional regulator [Actinoplanes regularis]GIE88294.1 helix-turn-helix transcriptional regulator [Actinoplanes regularis]SNS11155.1 regulatory protein, luxR family [Actinoplanes regularis]
MPPPRCAATTVVGVDGSGRSHRLAELAATFPGPVLDLPGRHEPARVWADRLATATHETLIVADDAHRLPGAVLCELAAAARRGVPMLVGRRPTIDRPELAELDEAVAGGATVVLEPLDVAGVAGLLGRLTGRRVPVSEAAHVHAVSAGRPAFVAALAVDLQDGQHRTVTPALVARIQRHLARSPGPVTGLARVLALRVEVADEVLAAAAGIAVAELAVLMRELRDSGWFTEAGETLVPAVAAAIRQEASPAERRRVHDAVATALVATRTSAVLAAEQLRAAQARTASAAAVYRRAGEQLRFTRPAEALAWFDDAVACGVEPSGMAASRAEAAALLGHPHSPDVPPGADPEGRLTLVAGAVAAHEGRAGRAADALLAAIAPGPVLAVPALVAVGRLGPARAAARTPAPASLLRLAEAALATGHPARALPLLIEAAEAVERAAPAVVLPDTPHALGALVAVTAGDQVTAEALLHRALSTTVGGPVSAVRHRLLLAWVRLRAGRYDTAAEELDRSADVALPGREALLRAALGAGLARRRGDLARMRRCWAGVEPILARGAVDLLQIEAVEELVITAARLRGHRRIEPVLGRLEQIVADLGAPPAWLVSTYWIRLQVAVVLEEPAAAERGAGALLGLARDAVAELGDRQLAQCAAAGLWAAVLRDEFEVPAVLAATTRLAEVELPWEGSRLAGQAALRVTDPVAARRLLEHARVLTGPAAEDATRAERRSAGLLSVREQTVARLVLAGRTHREIGAQLYISAKTVEHHVARIRAKLGADSRAELVAALHEALGAGAADGRLADSRGAIP